VGVDLLNAVLAEADDWVGHPDRTVLPTLTQLTQSVPPTPWDAYVLSGVAMPAQWQPPGSESESESTSGSGLQRGNTNEEARATTATHVFRFTPRANATVLSKYPATFRILGVPGEIVPVAQGRLVGEHYTSCSAAGFWIAATMVTTTTETERQ
jgi:hypothetical protein